MCLRHKDFAFVDRFFSKPGANVHVTKDGNIELSKDSEIIDIDTKENLLIIKGSIPGKSGNLVSIK